jgi:5-aminolevulinate synthase
MSNLQVLGRRCPIMGKALAVQSARSGSAALAGAFGGARAYHSRVNRAKLHTSSPKEAQTIEIENLRAKQGTIRLSVILWRHCVVAASRLNLNIVWDFS